MAEKTIYRIQVGVFSSKENAENLCSEIKALGSDYSNAFIKTASSLYKVFVGSFATETKAETMLSQLQIKGYSPFVVSDTITEDDNEITNSPLAEFTSLSPNNSGTRTMAIDRISPHCVVGQCTIESLGNWFSQSSTQASSNYGIDKDGRIGLFVNESDRSWCTSSKANDQRAVTIECACDMTEPYRMNDCVFESLVKLCADICKRNKKNKLIWINDKDKALSYELQSGEMLITVHRWFASTECPGDWLYSRLGTLAERVNALLSVNPNTETENEEEFKDWATENFVTKEELEERLKELNTKFENYITKENFLKELAALPLSQFVTKEDLINAFNNLLQSL